MQKIALFTLLIVLVFSAHVGAQSYTLEPEKKTGPFTTGYKKAIGVKMYPSAIFIKHLKQIRKPLKYLATLHWMDLEPLS